MKTTKYKITFPNGNVLVVDVAETDSPTIKRAIESIEAEPACVGVTLDNGIKVEVAEDE